MKKIILFIALMGLSWKGNAQFDSNGNLNIFSSLSRQPFLSLGINQTDRWTFGVYEGNNASFPRSFFIYEDHTNASGTKGVRFLIKPDGNVGIGTNTPDSRLSVNGTVHSKEVKVDLIGWPDYVFEDGYLLQSIEEVERYIAREGHLQNMPSTEQVNKNGILLGDMSSRLLRKIEELTLYTIKQQKQIEELKSSIEKLLKP